MGVSFRTRSKSRKILAGLSRRACGKGPFARTGGALTATVLGLRAYFYIFIAENFCEPRNSSVQPQPWFYPARVVHAHPSTTRPKPVNDRSTSVRHHRGSVGVGRTMGRLPASGRPRSCSLGTGPFVFSGVALATLFAPPSFARHINSLREHRAPAPVAAAKFKRALRSKSRRGATQKRQRCRSQCAAQRARFFARMVDRLFLLSCGPTRKPLRTSLARAAFFRLRSRQRPKRRRP